MIRATDILLISDLSLIYHYLQWMIFQFNEIFFFLHPRNLKNFEIIFRVKDQEISKVVFFFFFRNNKSIVILNQPLVRSLFRFMPIVLERMAVGHFNFTWMANHKTKGNAYVLSEFSVVIINRFSPRFIKTCQPTHVHNTRVDGQAIYH